MRGKGSNLTSNAVQSGITPACAGKSRPEEHHLSDRGDHPRLCGEKAVLHKNRPFSPGSPPLVRGKDTYVTYVPKSLRITPACAGKRRTTSVSAFPLEDHPRLCGEKFFENILYLLI